MARGEHDAVLQALDAVDLGVGGHLDANGVADVVLGMDGASDADGLVGSAIGVGVYT